MDQIIKETGYKAHPNLTFATILEPIISDMKASCKAFEPKAKILNFYSNLENLYKGWGYFYNFTHNGQEYEFDSLDYQGFTHDLKFNDDSSGSVRSVYNATASIKGDGKDLTEDIQFFVSLIYNL
jgi:hypothetical protein